jgi:hypothetical protein
MATTTPNFGWAVPTSTDLVKDGAVAIETLGDSIDASLVDLKGGTTGQVLAKASNTDMDFTWTADAGGATSLGFTAGKNRIINGDFGVWQRGTSFSITNTIAYTADRFMVQCNSASLAATISQQTFTPGTAPVAGYEGQFFLRVTNPAGATNTEIQQRIEDVRTFAGQTVTLSFWAKASSAVTMANTIIQNFGSGGSGTVSTTGTSQTLTTSWARYSTTINVPSVSGKTIGTSSYLQVYPMYYSSGTIASNVIDIWGVQIEAGSVATAFQTATGTIQGELAACQRYYWRSTPSSGYGILTTGGGVYSTTQADVYVANPVQMRVTPTSMDFSTLELTIPGTSNTTVTGLTFSGTECSALIMRCAVTVASGLTASRTCSLRQGGSSAAYLGFSAEL